MDHRHHLALTFSLLRRSGFTHGSDAVFEKLRALDAAQNRMRFHATLSTVWPRLIAAHIHDDRDFDSFIEREQILLDKNLPLRFYSSARLFSDVARQRFIEPDLRDLPRIDVPLHGFVYGDSPGGARHRDESC